jgi:predicted nucleotidyltransferase
MLTKEKIDSVVRTIVSNVHPRQIIVFGSYSDGTANNDSDLDLVVVWDTELNLHQRNVHLCNLFQQRDFPLDVFTYTVQELDRFRDVPGTVLYEAVHHGKVLYG